MEGAFKINGVNIMDGLLVPFMQAVRVSSLKHKNLTEDQILEKYDFVSGVVSSKIKKAQSEGKSIDKLKSCQD